MTDLSSTPQNLIPINLKIMQNTPDSWFCELSQWKILRVNGPDASTFLQGQVSCDVIKLNTAHAQLSASINLKGRMISNYIILKKNDEDFLLLCPDTTVTITQTVLKKYAIFSKVSIEQDPSLAIAASNKLANESLIETDRFTFSSSGINCDFFVSAIDRIIELKLNVSNEHNVYEENLFDLVLIKAGIIFIQKETSERFTPQEVNFEL